MKEKNPERKKKEGRNRPIFKGFQVFFLNNNSENLIYFSFTFRVNALY